MESHGKESRNTSRQTAKGQSTNAILSAATRVLSHHGYAGTTISRVSEAAGVSRGLLHYHFKNKEEMLAQVLQVNMEKSVELVDTALSSSDSPEHFADGLVSAIRSLITGNPDYVNLFLEGLATARYSDAVRRKLGDLYTSFRESLKGSLKRMERNALISPGIPPPTALAALITGMLDGIGIQLATVSDLEKSEEIWEYLRSGIVALLTTDTTDRTSGEWVKRPPGGVR